MPRSVLILMFFDAREIEFFIPKFKAQIKIIINKGFLNLGGINKNMEISANGIKKTP